MYCLLFLMFLYLGFISFLSPFPVSVSMVVSLLPLFIFHFCSYSSFRFLPFPIFLLPLSASLMFVCLFPRFLLSLMLPLLFFRFPPATLPPPPIPVFQLLPWSVFSFFSPSSLSFSSRLLLLAFLLVLLSLVLFLFCLLLSRPTIFSSTSSSPLPSSASWGLSFFVFSSSIGRFFLPFFFPFLASSFSLVFLPPPVPFLLLFSFLFLSVFPLSVFLLCYVFLSFAFVCTCVLAICGFFFVSSFLPFRLYSSAVSFLFRSPVAFCSSFPCSTPPSSALSAGSLSLFFAFPPVVAGWSPFFPLLRAPSAFNYFAYLPCSCFLLVWWFSLSRHLEYFPLRW